MKLKLTPLSGRLAVRWALGWFTLATVLTFSFWDSVFHLVPFLAFFAAVAVTAARSGAWLGIGTAIGAVVLLFGTGKLPQEELLVRAFALLANSSLVIWLGSLLRRGAADSQAYQEGIGDAVSDFVWSCDRERHPLYVNTRMLEFLGASREQFDMETWRQAVHPEDVQAWDEALRQGNRSGEHYDCELRYRRQGDGYFWFVSRASPLKNSQGEVLRWVGTSTNIDVRKRIEVEREQLLESERQARREAERASRMKDEFLATLSHELRTPLNAIVGWVHILKTEKLSGKEMREGLGIIERNSKAQTQLISELLDMSRIISGKVRLELEPVDLSMVIDAAVDAVLPSAEAKNIRLTKLIDPFTGELRGDITRLQQVIWNLLCNAIKFTPNDGWVEVRLRRVEMQMELSVADSGEGIEPAFLPHVFERFRQADASSTRRHGGLGLGLAIVKHLVELHGGTIEAKSDGHGRGSTFCARLPLPATQVCLEAPAGRQPARLADPQSAAETAKLGHVKVLVVDDEIDSREVIRRILDGCGAQVTTTASGQEALAQLRSHRFHTVISDIAMPDMDGLEFMRRVRADAAGGDIPAIALTAFARPEDRRCAIETGFDMFLAKPVEPAELIAVVERCATRSSLA